jgi:hypothetical protein
MLLGTALKKISTSLGFKPCCKCNKRAAVLDDASRRGFIKGSVFLVAFAAANVLDSHVANVSCVSSETDDRDGIRKATRLGLPSQGPPHASPRAPQSMQPIIWLLFLR